MIEAISAIGQSASVDAAVKSSSVVTGDFQSWLVNNAQQLNETLMNSDKTVQDIALDNNISVHEAMINMQKAQLTLQFTVEVRNKILESYQELMRMQL